MSNPTLIAHAKQIAADHRRKRVLDTATKIGILMERYARAALIIDAMSSDDEQANDPQGAQQLIDQAMRTQSECHFQVGYLLSELLPAPQS